MASGRSTKSKSYTKRLDRLQNQKLKLILQVQKIYQKNLLNLNPGKTLDVGCGIGRLLKILPKGSIGIDHNPHSIRLLRRSGMEGYTTVEFTRSPANKAASFDSLLFGHVLEHMSGAEGLELVRQYTPLIKKGGKIIIFCPQKRGYSSDPTHVTFHNIQSLSALIQQAGYKVSRSYSYPLPEFAGNIFKYNEFVIVGIKN